MINQPIIIDTDWLKIGQGSRSRSIAAGHWISFLRSDRIAGLESGLMVLRWLQSATLDQRRITNQRTNPDESIGRGSDLASSGREIRTDFRFIPVMEQDDAIRLDNLDLKRRTR